MITENLSTLKIHKLTQAQYDRELANGNIEENALYLTPDEQHSTVGKSLEGQTVSPTHETTTAAGVGAEIFNDYRQRTFDYSSIDEVVVNQGNVASGDYSHAEGSATTADGYCSHAEGDKTTASGDYSHAEGHFTTASGDYSHAEGHFTTAGNNSHAEGSATTADGYCSHAEGSESSAYGMFSHAEGFATEAYGDYSHSGGYETIANDYQYVVGRYNTSTTAPTSLEDKTTSAGLFIVGVGTSDSSRANGFRINPAGRPYAAGSLATSGADYAEYFEWVDGNPTDEDRRGRFVTLDGEKIRYATDEDDYILGIVSAEPAVIGDIQSEMWHNMFLKDIYGNKIIEVVEVEESVDENGTTIPAHTERRWVLNPNYNPDAKYISREERPEWDAVGIVGKLVVVDDGTCQVNGYCYPSVDGIATASKEKTNYRVMERLDDTHIKVFIR